MLSCSKEKPLSAQQIIDLSIEASGGTTFKKANVAFDFRGIHYASKRNNGVRKLMRTIIDSSGKRTKDILSPKGFKRLVNDSLVSVPDSMATRYTNSVNSVHYFAYLPQGLNDAAVNKELLEETTINGIPYHKIKITFDEEGGGTDFDDIFVYWINKETLKIDYLAYEFHVDGGGFRFREAYNERIVNGLRFVNYKNYKPKNTATALKDLDIDFQEGQLQLLSEIALENIDVTLDN